ncbi:TRAP transporter fused permease subunit [Oscillibacter sp.]|jgi:TRAP transporter 4TM/12TM fusion protein|uniref:TRAP transporter permease n=1 Tax=Oscillibacter sp. TaxID=1945593 RepID=UPI0025E02C27|nr:TRAP transporter fused permease subunit [Oscillibacter sp.]
MSIFKKQTGAGGKSDLDAKAKALASEPDEDSKIARMLKSMPRWRYWALAVLAVTMTVFQLYIKLGTPLQPWAQIPLHLCYALIIVFLFNPMAEKCKNKESKARQLWWIYDGFLIGATLFICWYFLSHANALNLRVYNVDPMTTLDITVAVLLLFVLMEAVRRVVSLALFVVILFFMAYAFFGQYISGIFRFAGMNFAQFCETLMLSQNGIFGSPLSASVGTLFYFMVFGAFFSNCGGGGVLIDAGMKLSDKTAGGPAKAAVLSSGLLGMISGSAVANVSTTGVLTIPLMKKAGYTPEEAGAVESVASTGGQIMPPIMGAGAFIMAEMIGIPYMDIATAAILPAVAYFGAVFILVHLLAKKKQMSTTNDALKYQGSPILPRVYRLVPIILLVIMIFAGMSMPRAAIYCTALSIILCMLSKDTRMSAKQLMETLIEGVRQAANVAIPTAACGIMIGIVVRSGVAVKVAKLIGTSGNNSLLLALVVAAVGCLMLGMALPTVAAYLIANTLFCSAIQGLGIEALVANMFIFYFGVVAQITPPVCLASFTAAGIANASAWKTGWKAFFFAITAFIAPFMFVYRPSILLIGTVTEILISCAMTACATFFLAAGVAGYMGKNLSAAERVLFFAAALMFIMPGSMFDLIGIVMGVVLVAWCLIFSRRQNTAAV